MPSEFSDTNYFRPCKGELVPVPGKPNRMRLISEFGHSMEIDLKLELRINAVDEFKPPFSGQPGFEWSLDSDYVNDTFRVSKNATSKDKIRKILKERNRIPETLQYAYFYIGYVFSEKPNDPTDNHWWIQFLDSQNRPLPGANFFPLELRIDIPVFTHHWRIPEEKIWHGRYKVMKNDVGGIFEPGILSYILKSKDALDKNPKPEIFLGKTEYSPDEIKLSKFDYFKDCENPYKIRNYFDVFRCIWVVEIRDERNKVLQKKEYANMILDVPQIGVAERMKPKSRVSFETLLKDVGNIQEVANTLIITR